MSLIYVTSPIHPEVLQALSSVGEVRLGYGPNAAPYSEIQNEVDAVFLRGGHISAEMIAASPKLRIVARHGAGYDNVDYKAAAELGVWVTNTPGANRRSVVEHVFALLLGISRKVQLATDQTRNNIWAQDRLSLTGIELEGRTLGLIGFGDIGRHVAPVAEAFGMKVLATDPAYDTSFDKRLVDLDTLLTQADVVSLHVPLQEGTENLISRAEIEKMKTGAILINTSRGGVIDEAAVADALRSGKLGGAGIDVLAAENTDMITPFSYNTFPVADLPNLLVTPHVAGQTNESLLRVGMSAVKAISAVLRGAPPLHPVNNPVPKTFN
ncbi:hydroxyacid dehydrogenase [Pseudomonas fluorescens]|uniref:Putative hydroxyacid dehydrogenase n=1 Tax=Pseudomonas fluorescens (strain Pf0-1) TaxID=205922 RepID=Q3KBX8_PSEPF|nr:hydroxyacid dehydrogenase [Pseudomonas fluorescens]ABA74726.1 putative hydroxyacid dehydrogenase [Pseudomonas fluorescens Pf0-1]MBY9026262.1 hydroxyacid dehydrogenase [Pseudomonas fluorescens]MBY9030107.1 hydroxyacid dehydrogenase [Pseudomonas fluorescens]MBY9038080.1 hydroxyacid dehydrogenase [Pseudomonas fluorescens]MBY9044184.1 hydroxyacid dehydrogenase [Pseudomonas fluorescens]